MQTYIYILPVHFCNKVTQFYFDLIIFKYTFSDVHWERRLKELSPSINRVKIAKKKKIYILFNIGNILFTNKWINFTHLHY